MSFSTMETSTNRQNQRPEIRQGQKHGLEVESMVIDLFESTPGISHARLSALVGVSRHYISSLLLRLGLIEPAIIPIVYHEDLDEQIFADVANENYANAELTALCLAHPGRQYEGDPAAAEEEKDKFSNVVLPEEFARYRADQSHTTPRKITLATTPYKVAA
jgi:hypothetical protein